MFALGCLPMIYSQHWPVAAAVSFGVRTIGVQTMNFSN